MKNLYLFIHYLYLFNMVVVERYALSFWWNGHEERVQCETAHYRDAKTTSCLPKISFGTVLSDPLEMPIVSARSLIVNRRFLCTNSLIWLTCCSSVDVDGRPGRSKSSTRSLPSLKFLYYLLTFFCDMVKSPKAFCNILNVSATEISSRNENLMALLCSTNSDIVKIENITFSRLENTSVTI